MIIGIRNTILSLYLLAYLLNHRNNLVMRFLIICVLLGCQRLSVILVNIALNHLNLLVVGLL